MKTFAHHYSDTPHGVSHPPISVSVLISGLFLGVQGIVFDPLGGQFTGAVARELTPGGTLVVYGTSAGPYGELDLRHLYKFGVTIRGYSAPMLSPEDVRMGLIAVLDAVAAEQLTPYIYTVLPLEAAEQAHSLLLQKAVTGKVLLQVGPERSSGGN